MSGLAASAIESLFTDELRATGGEVVDRFADGERLFLRAVSPAAGEVCAGDCVQGGVALRAVDGEITVRPFLFRPGCGSGAIRAHVPEAFDLPADLDEAEACHRLRCAIRACCDAEVFATGLQEWRCAQATYPGDDLSLTMFAFLSQLPAEMQGRLVGQIFRGFRRKLPTQYDLVSAVTAAARDAADPDERWKLEEFGARVALLRAGAVEAAVGV